MEYISITGQQIIDYYNKAKELVESIPNYETYADKYIANSQFKTTNAIFCKYYIVPNKHNVTFRMDKYNNTWRLNEYVGLYGKATEIRYIKPNKTYTIDAK